jgi:hypothetical protein
MVKTACSPFFIVATPTSHPLITLPAPLKTGQQQQIKTNLYSSTVDTTTNTKQAMPAVNVLPPHPGTTPRHSPKKYIPCPSLNVKGSPRSLLESNLVPSKRVPV